MQPYYETTWRITTEQTDCFDRLRLASLLGIVQEMAGEHSVALGAGREALQEKGLFWAVIRHRILIHRLPAARETIILRTWPMPTTRTAYPRACQAYDATGNLLFSTVSVWVLMDQTSRTMVLPGKSGVTVNGTAFGTEPPVPAGIALKEGSHAACRDVLLSDLDVNGHMNNCRCLDWASDVLGSNFFATAAPKEVTVCYFSEGVPEESLHLFVRKEDGYAVVDALRPSEGLSAGKNRVFSVEIHCP